MQSSIAITGLGCLLCLSGPVLGDANLVSVDRRVAVTGLGADPEKTSTTPGVFNEFVDDTESVTEIFIVDAFASQDTVVATDRIHGEGEVGFAASLETTIPAAAETTLQLIFELAEPHDFDLSGEITGSGPTSRADFALEELLPPLLGDAATTSLSFSASGPPFDTTDLASAGTLTAGTYRLTVAANFDLDNLPDGDVTLASFVGTTFAFDLNLAPVPEPGTVSVIVAGVFAMGRGRSSRHA